MIAAMMPTSRAPLYGLYALLAILLAISVMYQTRVIESRINELVGGQSMARFPIDIDLPSFEVTGSTRESEAAGIRRGDRITSVEGRRLQGAAPPLGRFATAWVRRAPG